jgi:hypothetical protein
MATNVDTAEKETRTAPPWLYLTSAGAFVFSAFALPTLVGEEHMSVDIYVIARVCCDTPEAIAFWSGAIAAVMQFIIGRSLLAPADSITTKMVKGNCVTLFFFLTPLLFMGLASAWPLDLWLGLALLAHWGLKKWDKKLHAASSPDFLSALSGRTVANLVTWTLLIGAALVPLCLAQIGFNVLEPIDSDFVFKVQMALIDIKTFLAAYASPNVLPLFILLLIAILLRQYELVASFLKAKTYVGRMIVFLTALTSFSFVAISSAEPVWVGRFRAEFSDELAKIAQIQRELIASVWLKEAINDLDLESIKDLQQFMHLLHTLPGGTIPSAKSVEKQEVVRAVAARLASTAPQAKAMDTNSDNRDAESKSLSSSVLASLQIIEKVRRWVNSGVGLVQYRPTLDDLKAIRATKIDLSASLKQSQDVVGEAFKSKLSGVATGGLDPLSQTFVKELISALAKQSLDAVYARGVRSFATAAVWLKEQKAFSKFSPNNWKLDLRRGQPKDLTSHAAMNTLLNEIAGSTKPRIADEQRRNGRGGGSKWATRMPSRR